MLESLRRRNVPIALINGRMSPRSYASWQSRKGAAEELLSVFDVIIGQNIENAERFEKLAKRPVGTLGNLKLAAEPLPTPAAEIEQLNSWMGERPRWLAASTHEGEEEQVLAAHNRILEQTPQALLFLAPRHPARGDEIEELCRAAGFKTARRSKDQPIKEETSVYLADTLGELGIFYQLSDIAFVGGSFPLVGGHNPLEPARLGCAILHGENIFNFADTYADMRKSGSAALVRNDRDLAAAVSRLLADEKTRKSLADEAANWASNSAQTVLIALIEALEPLLERSGIKS